MNHILLLVTNNKLLIIFQDNITFIKVRMTNGVTVGLTEINLFLCLGRDCFDVRCCASLRQGPP